MRWSNLKPGDVLESASGTDQRYLIVKVTPRIALDAVWVTSLDLADLDHDFVDTWSADGDVAILKRYWRVIRGGRNVKLTA